MIIFVLHYYYYQCSVLGSIYFSVLRFQKSLYSLMGKYTDLYPYVFVRKCRCLMKCCQLTCILLCTTSILHVLSTLGLIIYSYYFFSYSALLRNMRFLLQFFPGKMLQNLLYFYHRKTHVVFSFRATLYFSLMNALVSWSMSTQTRAGHSLGKNIK